MFRLAIASQAVPLVAFVASRNRTRAGALVAAGAFVSFVANMVGRYLAHAVGNNQVVSYISSPITATCFLLAFALWSITDRERQLFRWSVFAFLVAWLLLVAFFEDVRDFDRLTGPLYSLTGLAGALWTMTRRAGTVEAIALQRFDWFWICLGIAIQGAATAVSSPIAGILVARGDLDLFYLIWTIRGALVVLAYGLMSYGIFLRPPLSNYSTVR